MGRPPLRKATDRKASNQSVGFCDRIGGSQSMLHATPVVNHISHSLIFQMGHIMITTTW